MLIGCTSEKCKKWMHEQCIVEEALKSTYERLGTDKPHLPPEPVKEEKNGDEAKRPLSPTETGAGASHSIDVKSDTMHVNTNDNVEVKQGEDEDGQAARDGSAPEASVEPTASEKADADTPSKATPSKSTPGRKVGRPKKKITIINGSGDSSKPWLGLFEVALKTESQPGKKEEGTVLEFRDLRENVAGGLKIWTESVKCLVCGSWVN